MFSCCCCDFLWTLILAPFITFGIILIGFKWRIYKRKAESAEIIRKWEFLSKDKLVLHGLPRMSNSPNTSPYVLKLECYLKAAKIPYQFDSVDKYGPKRKTPWISYNGIHMGDSNLIIEYLNKEFKVDLTQGKYSNAELATAKAFRIMLEEHYFWAYARWVWIDGFKYIGDELWTPSVINWIMIIPFQYCIKLILWLQGTGLHTEVEFIKMMEDDLRALSNFLGDKKYFLGDLPCDEDMAFWGFIAGTLLRLKYSPYQRLIQGELKNLHEYFERMKKEFWPDWDKIIAQK